MEPLGIFSDIKYIHHIFDNLTKCQRYNGKVVTFQSQYRDSDQHTENRCCHDSDQKCQEKPQTI